ncbi:MAG: hypothetical protein IKF78_10030 [Atopobiaceae bacterium]|nr:hypothetical protein [Atopobiaceae bacterium]
MSCSALRDSQRDGSDSDRNGRGDRAVRRDARGRGLRVEWKCYDRDASTIRVEKAIAKAGGRKYETEPKTEASRRSVPVHPMLATMLD